MLITDRDLEIIETLAYRVPFLSIPQLVECWWPRVRSLKVVKRRLMDLIECGWLNVAEINLSLPTSFEAPAVVADPQAEWPKYEDVQTALSCADAAEPKPTEILFAGRRAKNVFASDAADLPSVHGRDHAQRLSAAFVWHKRMGMSSSHWFSRAGSNRNVGSRIKWDAVICPANGSTVDSVEATAICCLPISQRRWERLGESANDTQFKLELW